MLYEGNQMAVKLELDMPGENFFQTLKQSLRPVMKKKQCRLDRNKDYVRFSPHKNAMEESCLVNLREDQIAEQWDDARDWFSEHQPETKIYAAIERVDDEDDENDDD
jgi:hypothetical protein